MKFLENLFIGACNHHYAELMDVEILHVKYLWPRTLFAGDTFTDDTALDNAIWKMEAVQIVTIKETVYYKSGHVGFRDSTGHVWPGVLISKGEPRISDA